MKKFIIMLLITFLTSNIYAKLVDEVVAIVGNEVITKYEVESFKSTANQKDLMP